jgi:hypothetical protein
VTNSGFLEFLEATPQDRRDVFLGAAARLGTPEQNVEKISGSPGRWMFFSTASTVAIRGFGTRLSSCTL